jgi:hypothetical protein
MVMLHYEACLYAAAAAAAADIVAVDYVHSFADLSISESKLSLQLQWCDVPAAPYDSIACCSPLCKVHIRTLQA